MLVAPSAVYAERVPSSGVKALTVTCQMQRLLTLKTCQMHIALIEERMTIYYRDYCRESRVKNLRAAAGPLPRDVPSSRV